MPLRSAPKASSRAPAPLAARAPPGMMSGAAAERPPLLAAAAAARSVMTATLPYHRPGATRSFVWVRCNSAAVAGVAAIEHAQQRRPFAEDAASADARRALFPLLRGMLAQSCRRHL